MNRNNSKREKTSLKLIAYNYIKNKILNCEYEPHELLNEQQLCEEMGNISRTPIRDALGRLEQEGLITILPKKGITVSGLNISDISRIYEVRLLLEPYAIEKYGNNIPKDALMRFKKVLDHSVTLEKMDDYKLDDEFHALIMAAIPNRYLLATYSSISSMNHRFRIMSGKGVSNRVVDTYDEHQAIIDACLKEEWMSASALMHAHLEKGRAAAFNLIIAQANCQ